MNKSYTDLGELVGISRADAHYWLRLTCWEFFMYVKRKVFIYRYPDRGSQTCNLAIGFVTLLRGFQGYRLEGLIGHHVIIILPEGLSWMSLLNHASLAGSSSR